MKILTSVDLLSLWEQGLNRALIGNALNCLSVVFPELNSDEIPLLPAGERDQRLFQIRKLIFGTTLYNVSTCPGCSVKVEWENNIEDFLQVQQLKPLRSATFKVGIDKYHIRFRLPNSLDLSVPINRNISKTDTRKILISCIIQAKFNKKDFAGEDLPDFVLDALEKRMEDTNPLPNLKVNLTCPECEYQWEVNFDIVSYLWTEIDAWARHTLREVDILARSYGWSEQEILNMSPVRRQLYLEMANI